jgi:squalene-hopene/tetraprenyl-beta-curcumene cyclase
MKPPINPVTRLVRWLAAGRALRKLRKIQPDGGGFLEAAPLTSFVLMGLTAAGCADSPVVAEAVNFLTHAVRADGSWPIDTNLATWLTSLAVCALDGSEPTLTSDDRETLRRELLARQCTQPHPYTGAAAGGWAWSNLPGAVPDADDTASALRALRLLMPGEPDAATLQAAQAGAEWLLGLQNRDGGIPTFCRGWGKLPFDRSAPDLTANAVLAWLAWRDSLPAPCRNRVQAGLAKATSYLVDEQEPEGAFSPLWFGNPGAIGADDANRVYGTARVLIALAALAGEFPAAGEAAKHAAGWLVHAQEPDGGWGGDADGMPSMPAGRHGVEETALAVEGLARAAMSTIDGLLNLRNPIERGVQWLIEHTDGGRDWPTRAIGLYFAKLWYFERLYPLIFTTAALTTARAAMKA